MAKQPKCIVIGASAGGFEVIKRMVSQLPADFEVPIFVVLHIPPSQPSLLAEILSRSGPLPAIHPKDGTRIRAGSIYVAPPDHHLLIDDGRVAVKRGPKESGFRPSIDALFRSAAYSFGPRAIGVVLSGALNDGTSGLWSIKRLGGIAIVQDPQEAEFPSMPRSALEYIDADYTVRSTEIAPLLVSLVQELPAQAERERYGTDEEIRRMAIETQIAAGVNLPEQTIMDLGELSPFTCPECRGALIAIKEGNSFRFRCHTGHGFTTDALLEGLTEKLGELIWQVTRSFQEASMLLQHMAQHLQEKGESAPAEVFLEKSRELNKQASRFQRVALDNEILTGDAIEHKQSAD